MVLSVCLLLDSLCLPFVGWVSYRGGCEWWHPCHRSLNMRTRETSGSSLHLAWLQYKILTLVILTFYYIKIACCVQKIKYCFLCRNNVWIISWSIMNRYRLGLKFPHALWLTAFVTFLQVAVSGLHRGTLTVAVDAITWAPTLLYATATGHWAVSPLRPGRPAIIRIVIHWRGRELFRADSSCLK